MTLPQHYFDVLCCPRCRGALVPAASGNDRIACSRCASVFPVVEGIPVLLEGTDDAVSKSVASFYASAWKRDEQGRLRAKVIHEDMSTFGQRYDAAGEARFRGFFDGGRRHDIFLDAASGAQPRTELGRRYRYHVCLDMSLDGLLEARAALGDRAICVCGSLLQAPLRDGICDAILASHCLYHIDKDLQPTALGELGRMLGAEGRLVIFYGNRANARTNLLRMPALWQRFRTMYRARSPRPAGADPGAIYFYLHPIDAMLATLTAHFPRGRVALEPLLLLHRDDYEAVFALFGRPAYWTMRVLERLYRSRPRASYLVAYTVVNGSKQSTTGVAA